MAITTKQRSDAAKKGWKTRVKSRKTVNRKIKNVTPTKRRKNPEYAGIGKISEKKKREMIKAGWMFPEEGSSIWPSPPVQDETEEDLAVDKLWWKFFDLSKMPGGSKKQEDAIKSYLKEARAVDKKYTGKSTVEDLARKSLRELNSQYKSRNLKTAKIPAKRKSTTKGKSTTKRTKNPGRRAKPRTLAQKHLRASGMTRVNPSLKMLLQDMKTLLPTVGVGLSAMAGGLFLGKVIKEDIVEKWSSAPSFIKKHGAPISTATATVLFWASSKILFKGKISKFSVPILVGGMAAAALHFILSKFDLVKKLGLSLGSYPAAKSASAAAAANVDSKVNGVVSAYTTMGDYSGSGGVFSGADPELDNDTQYSNYYSDHSAGVGGIF